MSSDDLTYERAEELRKAQQFNEAATIFDALWQDKPNRMVGWRYAFCLRRLGQLDKANEVLTAALEKFPDDTYAKKELAWVLYDKDLKPAKEDSNLEDVMRVAQNILKLTDDALVLQRVSFTVMKVAKGRKRWNVALQWADKLKPEELSAEAGTFNGKRGMGERETWYVNRAHALFELNRFAEARAQAQKGLDEFPDEIFLLRTAALARAKSGDVPGGLEEMRVVVRHRRADWYMKAELADLEFAAGNYQDAYRLLCEALSKPQQDQFKIKRLLTLAQVALALDKLEIALEHVQLAKLIRAREGWSEPAEIQVLEKQLATAYADKQIQPPGLTNDIQELSRRCSRYWRDGATSGLDRVRGIVKNIPTDRPYTFITRDDGGENVYVLVKDLPRNLGSGEPIEFVLQKTIDPKKNRESFIAKEIQRAK